MKYQLFRKRGQTCSNKHTFSQNQKVVSGLSFVSLAFLHDSCLLNAGLEHYKSNFAFEQSKLPNNSVFGMYY